MTDNTSPLLRPMDDAELLRLAGECLADLIRHDKAHSCITLDPCCSMCEATLTLRAIDARFGTDRHSITGLATRETPRLARAS